MRVNYKNKKNTFSTYPIFLLLLLILASFLRFWRLPETMSFIGDFGWYYLEAQKLLTSNYLPLVGIPSSVPILHQGAIWTYVLAAALKLGNMNPMAGGIAGSFFGVLGVGTICVVVNRIWKDKRLALITSILAATTPFIVFHDRIPYHTTMIFPFTLVFAWLTYVVYKNKKRNIYWILLGVSYGLLLQMELAAIILIPIALITFYILSFRLNTKNYLSLISGTFYGLLPFFIYDFMNGVFIQTVGFAIWFLTKIYEHIGILIVGLIGVYLLKQVKNNHKRVQFTEAFTLVWGIIGIAALVGRQVFSEAYIPLLYFPIIILVGLFFSFIIRKLKIIGLFLFVFLVSVNTYVVIDTIKSGKYSESSIKRQIEVVDRILDDNSSGEFNYNYLGPGMEFASGKDNWEYLFWWRGANINNKNEPKYGILTEKYSFLRDHKELSNYGTYKIVKKNK